MMEEILHLMGYVSFREGILENEPFDIENGDIPL